MSICLLSPKILSEKLIWGIVSKIRRENDKSGDRRTSILLFSLHQYFILSLLANSAWSLRPLAICWNIWIGRIEVGHWQGRGASRWLVYIMVPPQRAATLVRAARRGSCFYLVHSSTYQQPSHNYTTTIHDTHKYVLVRIHRTHTTTDNVHHAVVLPPSC